MSVDVDIFDFPQEIVPKGMTYQWVAKTLLGEPHPSFQEMIDGGWLPVPAARHRNVFRSRVDAKGNVAVGGQVLMCRLAEVSRESHQLNEDAAVLMCRLAEVSRDRNAAARSRLVRLEDVPFRLSDVQMAEAHRDGISGHQYAIRRLKRMGEGFDNGTVCRSEVDPELGFYTGLTFQPATTLEPRHAWLKGLFNLVSKEK